ncbi:MAG: hypothetical protein ABL921_13070 [Pirellula sp.]
MNANSIVVAPARDDLNELLDLYRFMVITFDITVDKSSQLFHWD